MEPFTCKDKEHHKLLQALFTIRRESYFMWQEILGLALWDSSKTLDENSKLTRLSIHRTTKICWKYHLEHAYPSIRARLGKTNKGKGEWSRLEVIRIIYKLRNRGMKVSEISELFNRSNVWVRGKIAWIERVEKL